MYESHSKDMVGFGSVVKRGDNTNRQTDRQTVRRSLCVYVRVGADIKALLHAPQGTWISKPLNEFVWIQSSGLGDICSIKDRRRDVGDNNILSVVK